MNRDIPLFTLFHHNVDFSDEFLNFDSKQLYQLSQGNPSKGIEDIAQALYGVVTQSLKGYADGEVSLTLTGGMDSRVILACLLKAGVKPNCMVYGNPGARDVVFAKNLCQSLDLKFHNAAQQTPTPEWYYKWVVETIKRDGGNSHLHRAHRTAAIAEHAEIYQPKVLFTGHMGGEGLRGLTYNNYFASPFFEIINEGKSNPLHEAKRVLENYFIKTEDIDFSQLQDKINALPWMGNQPEKNKFFFLYDLVAKTHHTQDLRLYATYIPHVVPVYLQSSYLETLFASQHHFLAKGQGLMSRLKNPYVYCKVIEQLYPKLLDFPLANGFTPREYLKGLWYYIPVKLYRDHKHKAKYPPTFTYGQWYVDFVKEHAGDISPHIWEIFNRDAYMQALNNGSHRTDEGYWHRFSNPIYFDLVDKFKQDKL